LSILTFTTISFAQRAVSGEEFSPEARGPNGLRIMFYNVENLFDTFDDPATEDNEFTYEGDKHWSYYRYKEKLNNIAKTIISLGGWEPPDFIGLCEIENFQVLMDLTSETPLRSYGYQIIHENSEDPRGIDNAILYRNEKLTKIMHRSIYIDTNESFSTRDILYAAFSFAGLDTIHFYVNHWPSRLGGKEITEKKRLMVAKNLKVNIDQLQSENSSVKIFIMGDYNDEPKDKSLLEILNVKTTAENIREEELYNLSYPDFRGGKGTLVYKEIEFTWFLFDQMIVSGSLMKSVGLSVKGMKNHIFIADWLLNNGRPFRSYQGPIYLGGFSDHLPIFIDLYYRE